MSDTSGRPQLPESRKKLNRDTKKYGRDPKKWPTRINRSASDLGKPGRRDQQEKTAEAKNSTPQDYGRVQEYLWRPLRDAGITIRAFRQSELLPYLKRISEFIETSAGGGLEEVKRKFPVNEDSAFTWLQRKMRETAATQKTTDFEGAAMRAFQTGSTNWASDLLSKKDPTKFKLRDVVEAIRKDTDHALLLAANQILFHFGERLLAGAMPGGDSNKKMVKFFVDEFKGQHEAFMAKHNDASMWTSKALPNTVREYEQALAGVLK